MKIYNIEFKEPLFLAPLSGFSGWPMRCLSRSFGADLCFTEMISAAGLVRMARNTLNLLERPEEDRPLVAQIFSSRPDEASAAAKILEDKGFDGIDINMGCPAKKIVTKGAGAALMRDTDLALTMARMVIDHVKIPVSVKIRSGWDQGSINAVSLSADMEALGVDSIICHPRTRAQMFRSCPQRQILSEIRENIECPLVASGDIQSIKDISELKALGADAFMIGRPAIGNPWIFRTLRQGNPPGPDEIRETILRHMEMLCTQMGNHKGVILMRKFIGSYVRGIHNAKEFRTRACTLDNPNELAALISAFI